MISWYEPSHAENIVDGDLRHDASHTSSSTKTRTTTNDTHQGRRPYRRKFHSQEVLTIVAMDKNVALVNEAGYIHTVSWGTFDIVYEPVT